MKIDVHAHYIPERFIDNASRGHDGRSYGIRITRQDSREVLYASPPLTAAGFDAEQIYDIPRRLRDMQSQGIDMHALSVPPFLFLYDLEAAASLEACRRLNEAFAETVAAHPSQFVALADLPMQVPEEAAKELERSVKDLGLRGVEICSNINGMNLDDKSLAPFYAKAHELEVPIFIHPSNVLGVGRLSRYHLANLIGNPTDTAVAAASLIFGGVFKEFPGLKVYLAHGGGSCPLLRGRWEHGWRVRPEGKTQIQRPPSEYFRFLYFDTLTHSVPALNFLLESVGPERVMLGTDYPFDMGDYSSVKTVASLPHSSDTQKDMMYGGNAAMLFKIPSFR